MQVTTRSSFPVNVLAIVAGVCIAISATDAAAQAAAHPTTLVRDEVETADEVLQDDESTQAEDVLHCQDRRQ
jgi:hypothetical protein